MQKEDCQEDAPVHSEYFMAASTSPWWSYSDDIQSMMLDFISSSLPGKQISLKLEFETWKGSEG